MSENIQNQYSDENINEELSLEDLIYIFRKRFLIFFLVVVFVVAITLGYLLVAVPVYKASVTIKVEPTEEGVALDELFFSNNFSSRGDISTEIELIKSRSNLEKVVNNLFLDDILVINDDPDVQLTDQEKKKRAVNILREMVSVSSVKDTKIVSISVETKYRLLADDIANELANVYNEQLTDMAKKPITIKKQFLEKQLPETKKVLENLIEEVKTFKEETGIFILSEEGEYLLDIIKSYDNQINENKIQIQTTLNSINYNKDKIKEIDQTVIQSETISLNPIVNELRSKLTSLNIKLASLQKLYPPTDSNIILTKTEIEETQSELTKQVTRIVTSEQKVENPIYRTMLADLVKNEIELQILQSNLEALKLNREEYQRRLYKLPSLEQELLAIERELAVQEELYTMIRKQLEEVKITEAAVIGSSYIVDSAIVPDRPIKPNKKLTLAIGGVLGIFLGVLVIFVIEFFNKTVNSEEEIERAFKDNPPILGKIPHFNKKNYKTELYVKENPISNHSEALKLAVNNISYAASHKAKVIAISSAGPSEGKTVIASNIAWLKSELEEKTILLDFDMRKPRVEEVFDIDRQKYGVVNYLTGTTDDFSMDINFLDNYLHILPVGPIPPNPHVLLMSKKMDELIAYCKEHYDNVIIDTPPLLAAADVTLFANKVDAILLVAKVNKTNMSSLKHTVENIRKSNGKVLGFIINGVDGSKSKYYYYGYYGNDKKKKKKKEKWYDETVKRFSFKSFFDKMFKK